MLHVKSENQWSRDSQKIQISESKQSEHVWQESVKYALNPPERKRYNQRSIEVEEIKNY